MLATVSKQRQSSSLVLCQEPDSVLGDRQMSAYNLDRCGLRTSNADEPIGYDIIELPILWNAVFGKKKSEPAKGSDTPLSLSLSFCVFCFRAFIPTRTYLHVRVCSWIVILPR